MKSISYDGLSSKPKAFASKASAQKRSSHPGVPLAWLGLALAFVFLEAGCSSKKAPVATTPGAAAASKSADQPVQIVNPSDSIVQGSAAGGVTVTENLGAGQGKSGTQLNWTDVFFEFDRSEIKPDQRDVLEANARELRKFPSVKILVEGHCDQRGTSGYNMALGKSRAEAVKDYLSSLGISKDRIETISYGKEKPLAPGNDEASFARNRVGHVDKRMLNDPRF